MKMWVYSSWRGIGCPLFIPQDSVKLTMDFFKVLQWAKYMAYANSTRVDAPSRILRRFDENKENP